MKSSLNSSILRAKAILDELERKLRPVVRNYDEIEFLARCAPRGMSSTEYDIELCYDSIDRIRALLEEAQDSIADERSRNAWAQVREAAE